MHHTSLLQNEDIFSCVGLSARTRRRWENRNSMSEIFRGTKANPATIRHKRADVNVDVCVNVMCVDLNVEHKNKRDSPSICFTGEVPQSSKKSSHPRKIESASGEMRLGVDVVALILPRRTLWRTRVRCSSEAQFVTRRLSSRDDCQKDAAGKCYGTRS